MARPRKFDEAQVVRAARDQFWLSGYAGTTLDDLEEATGLRRGSLYGAFGDKHTLFMRAFEDYCADATAGVQEDLRSPGPAYERLVAHIRSTVESAATDVDKRGCLLAKGTAELASQDADVADRARATFIALHRAFTECVTDAQRQGDLDPTADPERVAGVVLTVLRGVEAIGKAGVDPDLLRSIGDQAVASLPRTVPAAG